MRTHQGKLITLRKTNVDTDQIIPKQFLKRIEKSGFGQFLFFDWRFHDDGSLREDFELNQPTKKDASILVSGENFGCGSSREHAPWSLKDYGFRIIIAPSFADIFYNNCLKNGIVPVTLSEEDVAELMKIGESDQDQLVVDIENTMITHESGFQRLFEIPKYWKDMVVNEWDEIDITLQLDSHISKFEQAKISNQ